MRIIGIDIGRGTAVCCPLDQLPAEPRQFNLDREKFYHLEANINGINELLELKPDICVLEPSGVNYAKIWCYYIEKANIELRLVGHRQCSTHREHLDLPDKEDETDAFCLAHYCWTHLERPEKFLQIRSLPITRIREIVLRLEHLNRVENPIVNRLRQDLAWQFPEIAKRQVKLQGQIPPLFFRWLAGKAKSKNYDEEYSKTVGLGLTETTRLHAARICDLYEEEIKLERELKNLILNEPKFEPYLEVFGKFQFGLRFSGILISQIYPFENFLGEDGKPINTWHKPKKQTISKRINKGWKEGDINKKVLKHISLRRFEKMLGIAPTEKSSGEEKKKKIAGGSGLCRKSFWRWIFTRVETVGKKLSRKTKTGKNINIKNKIDLDLYYWMKEIDEKADPPIKRGAKHIKIQRMKVASKIVRMLFNELVKTFSKEQETSNE